MSSRFFENLSTRISSKSYKAMERARMSEHTLIIIIAIIIGVLGGFAGVGIRAMIKGISEISFPGPGTVLDNIMSNPWYIVLLAPVVGGIIVGPIIYFFAPEAKGHGVPEVMQAILLKGGAIRARVAFIKAIASAISIGSGGSVGREGPIIQIGSSLGSMVGQFTRVPPKRLKTLVGCGAAAGIAAAFNAPIAGALFAVEIILMDFAVAQFSPIVISSVMATVISRMFEGDFAAFVVPKYQLASPYEIIFYFVLGGLCGLASFAFIKSLYFTEDFFDNKFNFPEWLKPAVGGLGVGIIGLFFPYVMGVGYDTINAALYGKMVWELALALVFLKIIATSITLGSGGSGGIFAPSLFMGAMVGYFFGYLVHSVFPETTATPGAYALVAMGGLVAGTTRAPITAIIIVFELTNDYKIILPLMVTCIISTILSSRFSRESIYTLKLVLKNIGIKEGVETNVLESIYVKDVYNEKFSSINVLENFSKLVKNVLRAKDSDFPVIDAEGKIRGMLCLNDIKDYLYEKDSLQNLLIAGDIANQNFETITPSENCRVALDKMKALQYSGLPVVEENDSQKVIGMIWRKDIQDAYDVEIERVEITSNLASSITMKDETASINFMEGYSIAEINPPKSFIGKSIRDLNIRVEFGVDVLSIKTKIKKGEKVNAIPNPGYVITENDTLIVAGEIKNINMIRNIQ